MAKTRKKKKSTRKSARRSTGKKKGRKAKKQKSLTKFQRWLVNNPDGAKATLKKKGWKV